MTLRSKWAQKQYFIWVTKEDSLWEKSVRSEINYHSGSSSLMFLNIGTCPGITLKWISTFFYQFALSLLSKSWWRWSFDSFQNSLRERTCWQCQWENSWRYWQSGWAEARISFSTLQFPLCYPCLIWRLLSIKGMLMSTSKPSKSAVSFIFLKYNAFPILLCDKM